MSDSKELIEILSLAPLEKYALLNSKNERRKLLASYLALREKVKSDFLHLIYSKEPYMNDHSRKHIERVLVHIESILEHNFPRPSDKIVEIPSERIITWADTLILLNALVWHDIGNIYGRKGHADQVKKCLNDISPYLYDDHLRQYIGQVAEAHSGEGAIEKKIPDSHAAQSYQSQDIHLQFLASILRFADEIDEDHRRAVPSEWQELDLIPKKQQRFWYFSKVNSSIQIKGEIGDFGIKFWVNIESHIPKSCFKMKFETETGMIHALTEYFRRLLKFDKERIYCNKYLKTFYHPGIMGFRVRLMTHENTLDPTAGTSFEFEISENQKSHLLLSLSQLSDLHPYISEAIKLEES